MDGVALIVSQVLNGLQLGSIYALVALGYTMVYGIILLLNFAHGDIIMVGAYVSWLVMAHLGLNPVIAIALSVVVCTLVGVLIDDVLATPAYCRVSRMIRDFSSDDIMAGNKKPNLRQMVESRLRERSEQTGERVQEIRFREIATSEVDVRALRLEVVPYETPATSERFLQWVTPEGRIAGFLRLSLPKAAAVEALASELRTAGCEPPVRPGEAMIREVHVYGMAARVGEEGGAAQHHGLGRKLVERARELAREVGYERINVISAVGTREYYRHLGFYDHGLYQQCKIRTEGMLHHG